MIGLNFAVAGEEDGDGTGVLEVAENDGEEDGEGNAEDGPGDAPDTAPEGEGEEDDERTEIEGIAHEAGLDDVADSNLGGGEADDDEEERADGGELDQGEQGGQEGGDDGADGRDIIEEEDEEGPEDGEVEVDHAHNAETDHAGEEAGEGFDADVGFGIVVDTAEDAADLFPLARVFDHAINFGEEAFLFEEDKEGIDEDNPGAADEAGEGEAEVLDDTRVVDTLDQLGELGGFLEAEPFGALGEQVIEAPLNIQFVVRGGADDVIDAGAEEVGKEEENDAGGQEGEDEGDRLGELKAAEAEACDGLGKNVDEIPDEEGEDHGDNEVLAEGEDGEDEGNEYGDGSGVGDFHKGNREIAAESG